MADLQFVEEEQVRFPRSHNGVMDHNARGMTGWLIKKGWVKNPNQAKAILFIIVIIGFAITFYNLSSLFGDGGASATTNVPPELVLPQ